MTTRLGRSIASTSRAPIWLARRARWKPSTPGDRATPHRRQTMNALTRIMTAGGTARVRLVAGAGLVILALTAGAYFYFGSRVSTDDAQVDAHIAPVAAKVSGNISEILVADNQVVRAGQALVRIDPR